MADLARLRKGKGPASAASPEKMRQHSPSPSPPPSAPALNYSELADVLLEFLEVAIHHILHARRLYPAELFEARQKYGVAVRMSRHPALNTYIQDCLVGVRPDLENGTLSKLHLAIYGPGGGGGGIVERFTFEVRSLLEGWDAGERNSAQTSININDLESHFAAFLIKLATLASASSNTVIEPNPPNCTFALLAELHRAARLGGNGGSGQGGGAMDWIPGDEDEVALRAGRGIVPIKTLDAGLMKIQLFVEENAEKQGGKRTHFSDRP
ncbi:MAD2 mitotic arrest deficient-like 2 [Geranomyces michiganensis]|nr:MAD2 mitotic arrest deficient-like 2 [Geranomyces michiganensis]